MGNSHKAKALYIVPTTYLSRCNTHKSLLLSFSMWYMHDYVVDSTPVGVEAGDVWDEKDTLDLVLLSLPTG
jgi:hypothetical protein